MSKALVTYFSASGVTKRMAEALASAAGADLFEIEAAPLYTRADLNWMDKKSRSTLEMNDPACRPAMAKAVGDLAAYDVVYIGFPVWWYTAPRIINTFIESADLSGKKIAVFATSGGSGVEKCVEDLKKAYPTLDFVPGKLLNGAPKADVLKAWVESL